MINPLDKILVTRVDDDTVPVDVRGMQMLPNTFSPRRPCTPKNVERPGPIAYSFESYRVYKHSWTGTGHFYKKVTIPPKI